MKLFQDFIWLTKVFYFSAILVKDDVISYTVGGDSDYSMKQLGARRIPTPTGWNISLIISPPPTPQNFIRAPGKLLAVILTPWSVVQNKSKAKLAWLDFFIRSILGLTFGRVLSQYNEGLNDTKYNLWSWLLVKPWTRVKHGYKPWKSCTDRVRTARPWVGRALWEKTEEIERHRLKQQCKTEW